MREFSVSGIQMKVNKILLDICYNLKNKSNVKKNYIEYISSLLYIKYVKDLKENIDVSFSILYKERKNFYIARIIDEVIRKLRHELGNYKLFSNIEFERISIYREIGEENVLADIIEIIYSLEKLIGYDNKECRYMVAKAYEYVLEHSIMDGDIIKGQEEFYTPFYITNIMSEMIVDNARNIFDPYCGSGNFLVSANESTKLNKKIDTLGIERDISIYNICMTNLLLHDIDNSNIIFQDETKNYNAKYDVILSNPPFSQKNWISKMNSDDLYYIYKSGLPKTAVADYAYVLSMFNHLEQTGKMAVILPHGVLFRENEIQVRRNLVENHYIDTIIGLPENLFYSNRISVIILILSKNRKDEEILFIDASKEYINDRKNNILTSETQKKLVDIYTNRKEVEYYSRLVSVEEIEKNNFNLTIKRYIKEKAQEKIKIQKKDVIKELENLDKEKCILEENINDVLESLGIEEVFIREQKEEEENVKSTINYQKIGQNIKKARHEKNYTQERLSEELNISIGYLSRIESGVSKINLTRLSQLCRILNVSVANILK